MQYRHEIEHAPANLALRREGLYSMWRCALMQYGAIIGARSR